MFEGREILIATKHEKEKAIAPILEKELGVKCVVAYNFDTDQLGTFTGEVERKDDPITTIRNKCLQAMEINHFDLGIASEGSFGPHPTLYFVPADDEFLIFIDKKNNLEIIVREISTETNFNGADIKTEKELFDFAKYAKFPSHALIIKNTKENFTDIMKGITHRQELKNIFHDFISKYGTAYVETDMRAMNNPTRMNVIEKAVVKLVNKINSHCPNCQHPGFGITNVIPGLPCELCSSPTHSTLSYLYVCQKCFFQKEEKYPNEKKIESAQHCDFCNP